MLQGPSAITFGRGSTGGVVNEFSKDPQMDRILTADVEFGSDLTASRRGRPRRTVAAPWYRRRVSPECHGP